MIGRKRVVCWLVCAILGLTLSACGISPRVLAQERLFLNLSLEFLDQYQLPKQNFENTQVGGLSAVTYDRQNNQFYVLSDDRSQHGPARFYTLTWQLQPQEGDRIAIGDVKIQNVTFLRDQQGETYPAGSIDPEGIALSPRGTLFISSEGVPSRGIAPFIGEFDLSGRLRQTLRLPLRYLPSEEATAPPQGIRDNWGFESLTLSPSGLAPGDPFRLFAATESSLWQDQAAAAEEPENLRFLHYGINPVGNPILVAEHLYRLDPAPLDAAYQGLTELTTLPTEGYFLSLERSFGLSGFNVKLFQVTVANATDTSAIASLKGEMGQVEPLKKTLLLDLSELEIPLDNLEAMTLGPRLPDGTQSLVLLSDDNFRDEQVTQLLLFRLLGS